jgi:argininosuccinate synthase
MLQAAIDQSQSVVTGRVRVKLYKGNVTIIGRESPFSLYDKELVTFEEGTVAYDQRDAAGFIKLNALRLRVAAKRDQRLAGLAPDLPVSDEPEGDVSVLDPL